MRWEYRFALPAVLLVTGLFVLLYIKFSETWDQYNAPAYAWASLQNTFRGSTLDNPPAVEGKVEDKVVIMARVESEDTDWVAENLPEYNLPVLILSDRSCSLAITTHSLTQRSTAAGNAQFTPSTPPTPP